MLDEYEDGANTQVAVPHVEITWRRYKHGDVQICQECVNPVTTSLRLWPDHHLTGVNKASNYDVSEIVASPTRAVGKSKRQNNSVAFWWCSALGTAQFLGFVHSEVTELGLFSSPGRECGRNVLGFAPATSQKIQFPTRC
jgi:hypothetical protein